MDRENLEREGKKPVKRNAAERVALYGLLIALAMVMSFVESLIPISIPIPGVKIGLSNLVTVTGLYLIGIRGTVVVTILRIVLTGLSFGNPYSMIYSLSGSCLSLCVMSAAKRYRWFSLTGISVLGGIFHNIGQLTFAALILRTPGLYYYLPALLLSGCVAGLLIGILGGILTERLRKITKT